MITICGYELATSTVKGWGEYVEMFSGLPITPQIMKEVIESHKNGKALMESSVDMGFETGEREWFMEMIAEYLIGLEQPTYGNSHLPEYQNFGERVATAFNEKFGENPEQWGLKCPT